MRHKKLVEKFERYWFSGSEQSETIEFTEEELDKLLQFFQSVMHDEYYGLALKTARRLFPGMLKYEIPYIEYLMTLENWDEAGNLLERHRQKHPRHPELEFLYVRYLIHRKDTEKALHHLQYCRNMQAKDRLYWEISKLHFQRGHAEIALDYLIKFIKEKILQIKHLHSVKKRMQLSGHLEKLMEKAGQWRNPDELIALAEEWVLLDETNPELWMFLGDRYAAGGLTQKAMQAYQKAQLLDPGYLAVYYKKAEILEKSRSERHKIEAIKEYLKSLKLSPSAYVNYKIGRIFTELQHPELAEVYFENALYEDPAYVPAWQELIKVLHRQGKKALLQQKISEARKTVRSTRLEQFIRRYENHLNDRHGNHDTHDE